MFISNNKNLLDTYLLGQNIKCNQTLWQQIELRILMVTKHIYFAAKKNNVSYINYLQSYLINCVETKIFFINKIICYLLTKNNISNQIRILLIDIDIKYLLQCCSNPKLSVCNFSNLIVHTIKRFMLYLVVEPILYARLSINFLRFMDKYRLKKMTTNLNDNNYKDLLAKVLAQKLSFNNIFNLNMLNVICNNKLVFKIYEKNYKKLHNTTNYISVFNFNYYHLNSFDYLFNLIILNEINWYTLSNIKNNNSLTKNDNTQSCNQLIDAANIYYINLFYTLVKKILYRKTLYGFKVINRFFISNKIINNIRILYRFYYSIFPIFININIQQSCNLFINCFLNRWINKHINNKFVVSKHNIILIDINKSVNKFTYLRNITNNYSLLL